MSKYDFKPVYLYFDWLNQPVEMLNQEDIKRVVKSKLNKSFIVNKVEKFEDADVILIMAVETIVVEIDNQIRSCEALEGIMIPSDYQYNIKDDSGRYFLWGYAVEPVNIGIGSKEFKVEATLTDKYTITVMADTEEEALKLAYDTELENWHHLDIYPELKDAAVVRFSKWGNLKIL